jgi:hypothetical protein
MKKLSRIISSNAIVRLSGERQKNAVPTSHPVPARSVSRVEVSPPHSAPDSAIASHVPGPCVPSSDPVVRNSHPAFAECLRAGRCRLLGTAPSVHHIRAPLSRGKSGLFRRASPSFDRLSAVPNALRRQSYRTDHWCIARPAVRRSQSVATDGCCLERAVTSRRGRSGYTPARPEGRVRTAGSPDRRAYPRRYPRG